MTGLLALEVAIHVTKPLRNGCLSLIGFVAVPYAAYLPFMHQQPEQQQDDLTSASGLGFGVVWW